MDCSSVSGEASLDFHDLRAHAGHFCIKGFATCPFTFKWKTIRTWTQLQYGVTQ